jgi:hypothetical protein
MLFRHQERKGRAPLPDFQRDPIPAAAGLTDPLQRVLAGALQAAFDCELRSPRAFVLQFLNKIIPLFAADSPAAFIAFVCEATHAKREMVRPDKPNVVFPLVRGAISRSEEAALALLKAYPVSSCVRDLDPRHVWRFISSGETDPSQTEITEPFAGDAEHERYDDFMGAIYAFAAMERIFGANEFAAKISERLFGESPEREHADTTPVPAHERPDGAEERQEVVPSPQPVQFESDADPEDPDANDVSRAFNRIVRLPTIPPQPVQPTAANAAKTRPAKPSLLSPPPASSDALPPRSLDEPPSMRNPAPAEMPPRRRNLPSEPELSMGTADPERIFDGLRSVPPPAGSSAYVDDDGGETIARPSSPPGTFPAFPRAPQAYPPPPPKPPSPMSVRMPPRAAPPPIPGAKALPNAKTLSHTEATNQQILDILQGGLGLKIGGATNGDPLVKILNMALREHDPAFYDVVLDTTDGNITDFGNALSGIVESLVPDLGMKFRNLLANAGAASPKPPASRMPHFAAQMAATTGQPGGRLPPPPKRIPPPPPPPPPRRFG